MSSLKATVSINAPKEKVWEVITNIENAAESISGIEEVEILEKPESGLVGLKWKETRIMFGKTATEVMWITEAVENDYYKTRAESHGSIYTSTISVEEKEGVSILSMEFGAKMVTLGAKIMGTLMMPFFKGATRKALQKDLDDIKARVEGTAVPET